MCYSCGPGDLDVYSLKVYSLEKQVSDTYILYKRVQYNLYLGKEKSKGVNVAVFSSARVAIEF